MEKEMLNGFEPSSLAMRDAPPQEGQRMGREFRVVCSELGLERGWATDDRIATDG